MRGRGKSQGITWGLILVGMLATPIWAQKFYPDDPLEAEPPPLATPDPGVRGLSDLLEFFSNTFTSPGERHPEIGVIPAGAVNTLGEVMDSSWYTNRHGKRRLSREELVRGAGDARPPLQDQPWRALAVKQHGNRPGILMVDSQRQIYLLRFDPPDYLEMSTGAEMVSSKIFHALGYNTLENYIVYFPRAQMVASEAGEQITSMGERRDLTDEDIDSFLKTVAVDRQRGYRAVATRVPVEWDKLVGNFQFFNTRSDDPNDIVPHEHRRDLRGLFVFAAWLNHNWILPTATLDVLVVENDIPFIRHFLLDFTSTLGSGDKRPKTAREGNEPMWDRGPTAKNVIGLGIFTPRWMRASYPKFRSVGRFEYETFDPEKWVANQRLAPFENRLPDDTYWAAKQVMAFSDEDLQALVSTGQYSDPAAAAWIVRSLAGRRDRIGQTYFPKILSLEHFRVENDELVFDDLAVAHGFAPQRNYRAIWYRFDNESEEYTEMGNPGSFLEVPLPARQASQGSYYAARIWADDREMNVTVFLRKESSGFKVVGIDRQWPGKQIAEPSPEEDLGVSIFGDLEPAQQVLVEGYTAAFNERSGRDLSTQEYFDSMSVSERTTYEAVTHALMNSKLTDQEGNDLGNALDLVNGVERIAGQYYGRGRDQQFRLYVFLVPGAKETLEKSKEFFLGHENTVYHAGYPESYRQEGKVPNIQFSLSEDEMKADIDVDYRSSKMPGAMFNGHLTSANSDVRAGDNHDRHTNRWSGLVAWWQQIYGDLARKKGAGTAGLLSASQTEIEEELPPDRLPGAAIAEVHEATQEFLTDWLVRQDVDEALEFLSDSSLACINTDDDPDDEVLRDDQARRLMKELMEALNDEMGDRDNLAEAIEAVMPVDPTVRMVQHPFENDFAVGELTVEHAERYLCEKIPAPPGTAVPQPTDYGIYWAALFRFKMERDQGGVLGLLWQKENGNWKIVSYEAFEQ